MRMPPFITALVGLGLLAGCSAMEPGLGFDDVESQVASRTGASTHWNTGSSEDAEAQAAVTALLAGELSADGAIQVALLSNRELQAMYEDLSIAQADVVQAGLLHNPVFSGEVRFASGGGGTAVVLDAAQDFVSILSMPLRRGRALAEFETAKLRVTGAVLDMAFETRTAFYDMQAAEQMRQMRSTVLEATGASYELALRLRAAGNNRELDVQRERALVEQSRLDLAMAEADVVRARERLNALMGLWGEGAVAWRAADRLPALPEADPALSSGGPGLESRAIEASLELAILRREGEIAARTAGIARPFAWLDSAEVGVAGEREGDGAWSVGPSLALPIPLLDQGQAAIGAAQARYRQAAERLTARAIEIRARVRAAHSDVVWAYDRATYLQSVMLPLRAGIVDQTQLQYNAMQVSAFELLQAKRDQITTGGEFIAAVHDYWLARATLDQILAGRLPATSMIDPTSATLTPSPGMTEAGGHR